MEDSEEILFQETYQVVGSNPHMARYGGVQATYAYIYPVGATRASQAWSMPVILVGDLVVWTGEPVESFNEAKNVAVQKLASGLAKAISSLE